MRFIAFDLETTGILPGVDRIVEVGAVRFINGEVDGIFSTLVNPRIPMPPAASRVNGITDEMLSGKPFIEQLLDPFAEFCGDDILVAHNAPFDAQFVTSDVKKYESRAPRGPILCSYSLAKKVYPGLLNYKLGTLVQHLGIPSSDFHRAEQDASYCGQLFIRMIQKLTGGLDIPPVETLLKLSGKVELRFPQIERQPKQMEFFAT